MTMSYKSILVHLDTSARAHPRFEMALQLAHQFHARLTGVSRRTFPHRTHSS
jgi:nucleotide-binding universal stress UspA family protein